MPLQEPPAVVAFDERVDLLPGLLETLEVVEVEALLVGPYALTDRLERRPPDHPSSPRASPPRP